MEIRGLSELSHKKKVVVFLIGGQVSISLAFMAFTAIVIFGGLETFNYIPKALTALMIMLSGPINLVTITTFPLFAAISTILCAGFAVFAIKWTSYLLTSCFMVTWFFSAASGLVYAA